MKKSTVDILGTKVSTLSQKQTVEEILAGKHNKQPYWIVTPNPEIVLLGAENQEFKKILNQADLAIPDGIGLLAAAEFHKQAERNTHFLTVLFLGLRVGLQTLFNKRSFTVIPEQVSGDEMLTRLMQEADHHGWKVFLLGGRDSVAEIAARVLKQQFVNIDIQYHSGPQDVSGETKQERQALVAQINAFEPDLLFVAFGAPFQERWLYENRADLRVKVMMGVGGSLDVIAKKVPASPTFLRKLGLRWLWRVIVEPKRLPRIFRATVVFPWKIFQQALRKTD